MIFFRGDQRPVPVIFVNLNALDAKLLFKYHNNDDEDNPDYLPKKDAECLKNKK